MTVLEAIQKSTEFLARKGVESPRLQAELLLAHVLRLPRMRLYLNFEKDLSPAELDALREAVRRRGLREPLQHIVGTAAFCTVDLKVNPSVLIPRPETELLAEAGWTWLNHLTAGRALSPKAPAPPATAPPQPPTVTALDLGTGSGCLAISLARHCPAAHVTACDISPAALAVARENAALHQVDARITFLLSDGFSSLSSGLRFDLILSNPPYIPTAEIQSLAPEVRDHDPRQALDGGADGLVFYRRLATEAPAWLHPGARLMAELGDNQSDPVRSLFEHENWVVEEIRHDYNKQPRVLIARLPNG